VPEERARALQAAFMATHRDAGFLAEAAKLGLEISPVGADEVMHSIDAMAHASPEAFNYMKKLMAAHKGG
jgi:hypothetical protein